MNPELLLTHFDRISDAPDAIPRLRRFILDLAVRGKLVEQDLEDEPASELLKRIQAEKARRCASGDMRQQPKLPQVGAAEIPFGIPKSWEWVRLIDLLFKLTDGTHHSPPNLVQGDFKYITAKNIKPEGVSLEDVTYISKDIHREIYARCNPEKGDILYIKDGATTGVVTINNLDEPFSLLSSVALLKVSRAVPNRFLVEFLRSPFFYVQMRGFMKGAAITRVTLKRMAPALIPLPPFAEQHRIVAKVDELMALCDRLEAAQRERESRRDRLAAASHHHLNNGENAEAFRKHADFFLGHLPHLTTRPDQIKQLRQTILNLAVRGQLVPQVPNDEPASELLKRIQVEKARLVKDGIIKKLDSIALPPESAFPSPLPSGWTTSNLQSLCISVTDGDHLPPPKADQGIPFLVIGNVRGQTLHFAGCRHVSEQYYNALGAIRRPQKNDILYTLVGSYGIPVMITDDRQFCVQRHIGILRPSQTISVAFLSRMLESKWVFDLATACATGIAQKTVPLAGLRKILIPLPPLAEQHRIVAKVDELMAVCDRLEAQLTATQVETRRLLEAVLHEALVTAAQ